MPNGLPGNGSTSPFGNGDGTAGQPKVGGNNFLINPAGNSAKSGGRDFTQEKPGNQPTAPVLNPDSIPSGGKYPVMKKMGEATDKKPFKLNGESSSEDVGSYSPESTNPGDIGTVPGELKCPVK